MFELENTITINKETISDPNLCHRFTEKDLTDIGNYVGDNYKRDVDSREDWLRRSEAALDLAMQVQKAKTFPWPNCSNIAFPLVTIAALQFHARAYPAVINGRSVVQMRVIGPDPSGVSTKKAKLISDHMSWQLLEQDSAWEESMDMALLNVAIVGTGWKKTYYDQSTGTPVSKFVNARNLIVNYWAPSIEAAPAATEVVPLWKNDIHERVKRGTYRDCLEAEWYCNDANPTPRDSDDSISNRSGITKPAGNDSETPFTVLEQHCWLDLDDDGYAEPYVVTFEENTNYVLRIVTRFNRIEDVEFNNKKEIVKITPTHYYTKIPFIPSPDGGIMDKGFGTLLGPLNESVNSAINQLFDSGTISNTAGGFLGRGAKIRGGTYQFQPFGWQRVDATGDDLRKSIFPLPVREPSAVMFNLLSLLIDYTNRVSGATDMLAGENPGQNTPAETGRAMVEQGQKVYSAIFKRIWRSMKLEFRKVFVLNSLYLPDTSPFGDNGTIRREDYSAGATQVVPAADPTIASDGARFAQARLLREAAATNPGYDADEVERSYLHALGYDNVDTLYPGQKNMPPGKDVKVQIQELKNQVAMAEMQQQQDQFIMTTQMNLRLNDAKIMELTAKANLMEAQAVSLPAKQNVEAFRAGIEALREQNKGMEVELNRMMESRKNARSPAINSVPAGAAGTVPLLEGPPSNQAPL